jgi:hypothetical protein
MAEELEVIKDGNPNAELVSEDFTNKGEIKELSGDLALVVGSAKSAEAFIANKQWHLLWRDADLLYQAPRPMSVYENTYILEPNVQRFTVAKVCNAVVPQLYKGLFYDDPPMILRPRAGTKQEIVDANSTLFSYMMDACNFKRETKWGLEQMAHLGTSIWKWGIKYEKVEVQKRTASRTNVANSSTEATGAKPETIVLDEPPQITTITKTVPRPFFEYIEISRVLLDSHTEVGDIREAKWACHVKYMDFYDMEELEESLKDEDGKFTEEGWSFPADLKDLWCGPTGLVSEAPAALSSEQQSMIRGVVHHAEDINVKNSPDPLRKRLEVLEYWDKGRKILVLDRKKVIYTGKNPFKQLPFLSANWWNRRKAFYGMGLGLIVGQNQRVDQGTINAILKILSFGINPIYLRKRDSNSPTQMIRTGLGKILTVDGEVDKAYKLMDTPRVPTEVWSALQESERATESSSGADQMLVQGSTAGPRTSMGRTAGGANILAGASATRLDGPLDNFIGQVFTPFLYILDYLIFNYVPDSEIISILGEVLGKEYADSLNMQDFHDAKYEYEVLAGASLAAKRTMAQSMTLITQIFSQPNIQENLADINEEYIDFKPILSMWMEASEWKNKQDIIKKMTPEMKKKRQAAQQAAQQQSKMAMQQQSEEQKFKNKQQLEDQATEGRIKRDLVREAFRKTSGTEASEGAANPMGLGGEETPFGA